MLIEKPKQYRFVEPEVTRKELVNIFVKGLVRPLTQQEANIIHWLSNCDYETRGVIVDLFKELVSRQED